MVVQITPSVELAGVIAAQVVTMRSDGAGTIYAGVVVDDAVLERCCSAFKDAAIKDAASRISANGAVIHCEGSKTNDDSAPRATARSRTAVSAIPCDGAVVQRHCGAESVECAANTHPAVDGRNARSTGAITGESTVFNHQRASVVDAAAKSRAGTLVAV